MDRNKKHTRIGAKIYGDSGLKINTKIHKK